MVKLSAKKKPAESRWIDQLLVWAMTVTTIAAIGVALQVESLSLAMIGISTVGTLVSYFGFVHRSRKNFVFMDGFLLIMIACFIGLTGEFWLNLAPTGTWTGVLQMPGLLAWFVCLSTFCQWTDSTRMFQAVPCIALFGLMGVYDTFGGVVIAFFVFLLILASTFGRAHSRSMLKYAFESGFSRIDEGTSLKSDQLEQDAMLKAMRRGPWRAMAGTEMAAMTAVAVIVVSLIAAPLFQQSAQDVTGHVQIMVPHRLRKIESSATGSATQTNFQSIATGPAKLSNKVIGMAFSPHSEYLQQESFSIYSGTSWNQDQPEAGLAQTVSSDPTLRLNADSQRLRKETLSAIWKPKTNRFVITLFDESVALVPIPPVLQEIQSPPNVAIRGDGAVPTKVGPAAHLQFQGISVRSTIPPGSPTDPDALHAYPDLDGVGTTQRVRDLVNQITKGLPNDWAKAVAIKKAIAARCVYDINTPAYPPGHDDVDYFLFTTKRGYCEMFASAMTVMARCAGIQSNYAIGYLLDPNDAENGTVRIRDNDAHAWSILNFHDVGWVIFDATEGAKNVSKTDATGNQVMILAALGAIGAFAAILLVGKKLLKKLRERLPVYSETMRARRILLGAFDQFCRKVDKGTQIEKRPSWTVEEYIDLAAPGCGEWEDPVRQLGGEFEELFYGMDDLTLAKATEIRGEVALLKIHPPKKAIR